MKYLPYVSHSDYATKAMGEDNKVLARKVFFSSEKDPGKVPCPWTGHTGCCRPLRRIGLIVEVPKGEGRIPNSNRYAQTSWELATEKDKPLGDRAPLPSALTTNPRTATCYDSLVAAGHEPWVPEQNSHSAPASTTTTTTHTDQPSEPSEE